MLLVLFDKLELLLSVDIFLDQLAVEENYDTGDVIDVVLSVLAHRDI